MKYSIIYESNSTKLKQNFALCWLAKLNFHNCKFANNDKGHKVLVILYTNR